MAAPAPTIPFLSRVTGRERQPLRILAWVVLALLIGFVAAMAGLLVLELTGAIDSQALAGWTPDEALPDGPRRLVEETRLLVLLVATLGGFAYGLTVAASVAFRRPNWTFLAPVHPFRLKDLLLGFGLFGLLVLANVLVGALVEGGLDAVPAVADPKYALDTRLLYVGAGAVFILCAAAAEEVIFRGVFLQVLGAFTRRPILLCVLNGVVFSAFHLDPDPGAFVARAASGAVWTWAALRLGGLEFAIGAHFANNLVLLALGGPFSEEARVGRELPPGYLAMDVATTVAAFLIVEAIARRREQSENQRSGG